jgi:hypothetical protein
MRQRDNALRAREALAHDAVELCLYIMLAAERELCARSLLLDGFSDFLGFGHFFFLIIL